MTTPQPNAQGSTVEVQITAVIEREFKRRDLFPELRLENAIRIVGGATGIHKVAIDRAKELLTDAEAMQARNRELPRGIPAAYTALARNISAALRQEARRGLWDDPGYDVMAKRATESPAAFQVGDTVLLKYSIRDEGPAKVVIVQAYGLHKCGADDGAFVMADGKRVSYRFGYVVGWPDGRRQTVFVPAHELSRCDDDRPTYLRLVYSQPAPDWRGMA